MKKISILLLSIIFYLAVKGQSDPVPASCPPCLSNKYTLTSSVWTGNQFVPGTPIVPPQNRGKIYSSGTGNPSCILTKTSSCEWVGNNGANSTDPFRTTLNLQTPIGGTPSWVIICDYNVYQDETFPAAPPHIAFFTKTTGASPVGIYTRTDGALVQTIEISDPNAAPPITINPASPEICAGKSIGLTASSTEDYSYTWSPATGLSFTTGPTVVSTPSTTTIYLVIGTHGNNCNLKTVKVVVNPNPTIIVTPNTATICNNMDYATLTASGAGDNGTYSWSPGDGIDNPGSATVHASPVTTTAYSILGTDAKGCVNVATATVSVQLQVVIDDASSFGDGSDPKHPPANIDPLNKVYFGAQGNHHPFGKITLVAKVIPSQIVSSYQWTKDNGSTITVVGGSASYTYNANDPNSAPDRNKLITLSVRVIKSATCTTYASKTIGVLPLPPALPPAKKIRSLGSSTQSSANPQSNNKTPISNFINSGALLFNPTFQPDNYLYTGDVNNSITSVTLTPTLEDTSSDLTINGVPTTSESTSQPINLSVGKNLLQLVLTAYDGTTETYTITITRADASLTTGLVAYYPFDNDFLDHSGNANDGTLHLGSFGGDFVPDRNGSTNSAYSFGGSNGQINCTTCGTYIDCGNKPTLNQFQNGMSTSYWVKFNPPFSAYNRVFGKQENSSLLGWGLNTAPGSGAGAQAVYLNMTQSNSVGGNSHPNLDGVWYHVVVTADPVNNSVKMYVNGVPDVSINNNNMVLNCTENLTLGAYRAFGFAYFKGLLDEVKIWNRVLSEQEVAALYGACPSPSVGGNVTGNALVCSGANSGTLILAGHIGSVIKWQSSIDGGTNWADIANTTISQPYSNLTTTTQYRVVVKNGSCAEATSGLATISMNTTEINVQGNATTIVDGDATPSVNDHTNFGSISISGNIGRTFTIQNTGTAPLSVTGINLTGANAALFSAGGLSPASPISAGSLATFTVTFTPATAGLKTAVVNIASNDCDAVNYDFVIQGTGALFSNDPNLSNLLLSSGTITPTFATITTAYTASVTNCVSSIKVTPVAEDNNATIKVNGVAVTNGTASVAIPLSVGSNTITVIVTAQDATTTKTYTINVTRGTQTSLPVTAVSFPKEVIPVNAGKIDFYAKLSGFTGSFSAGGITPHFFKIYDGQSTFHSGFNSNDGRGNGGIVGIAGNSFFTGTYPYASSFTYEQILGAAQVSDWHHYIFKWNKNGISGVGNGQQKVAIYIDGVLKSGIWSNVAPETFQSLTSGTLNLITTGNPGSANGEVAIDEFKIYDGNDNLVLHNTLGSENEIKNSVVGLNGFFNTGGNPHFVPGISGNAVMATPVYSVGSLNCSLVNPNLSNLVTSAGALTPLFDPANTAYTVTVANNINTLTVTPTAASATATITVNGIPVISGNASGAIPIYPGNNTITTIVTEQDGTNKNYTIIATKASSPGDPIGINSEWVWINGDNTINPLGIYGTQGVSAPANKPVARHGGVSWTDNSGNLWLFGGGYSPSPGGFLLGSPYGLLNDLWKYNPSAKEWTWMKGDSTRFMNFLNNSGVYGTQGIADPANKPGASTNGVSWKDVFGNLWLFAGDLWKYDPSTNQWTWMKGYTTGAPIYGTMGIPGATNNPGSRSSSISWTDASGNLWLFGGGVTFGQYNFDLNDLWKFDISTNQWTWMKGDNNNNAPGVYGVYGTQGVAALSNKPCARNGSVSWTDASGNFWLFGGKVFNSITGSTSGSGNLNDLWKYDPNTNMWTWMKGASNVNAISEYGIQGIPALINDPGARDRSVSWTDIAGNLWLFGGWSFNPTNNSSDILNDLWKYNISTGQWTWMKGDKTLGVAGVYGTQGIGAPRNKPGARVGSNAWAFGSGKVFLFGGGGYATTGYGSLNDLWELGPNTSSGNADLCNMILSNGTPAPIFASNNLSYTASVANNITSITITPTSCDPAATIWITLPGISIQVVIPIPSGSVSQPIPLAVGDNLIMIHVTSPDGTTTKTYIVNLTRAATASTNNWYVNDNSTTGDQYTTAIGNDATGTGSTSAPFRTINKAMTSASAGDIIYVDAGTYPEYVNITKSLKFYGPNANISPNGAGRNAEAIVNAANTGVQDLVAFEVHTQGTNVEIKGFKIINSTPLSDGHNARNAQNDITVLFEKNWIQHGTTLFAGTLTPWKNVTIKDNYFDAIDMFATSSAVLINDAGSHVATITATITGNTIGAASFAGIMVNNILSADVSGNVIRNTAHAGILLAGGIVNATIKENEIANTNLDHVPDAGGIKIHGSVFTGLVNVLNNSVTNSFNALAVFNGENLAGKDIHIHDNSFDASNINKSMYHGGSGNVDATCNWLGTADQAIINSKVFGPVTYITCLNNGTDNDPVTPGFQPVAGSCSVDPCASDHTAPVLISKNATVQLDASGHASIIAADVIQSLTDNCDPNPIVQLSRSTFSCADIVTTPGAAGNYQAYKVGTSNGNQAYQGELGLEFKVNNAIVVKQLGAFDHQANGITGTQGPNHNSIRVAIFNKTTLALVAGLDELINGNADEYTGNYRMKNVTPVTLPQGTYVIVAKGYNANELNGNRNVAGIPITPSDLNDGNGAISFTGSSYGDDTPIGFSFPVNNYTLISPWIAGTFKFDVPTTGSTITNKVPITITATDSKGNSTQATAIITVEDPLGACTSCASDNTAPVLVSKNVTVHLNAAGQASIQAADVIQSLTDNCDPNPSVQLSRSAFSCADIVATPGVAGNYQAYNVGTSNGNQAYAGELGLEFKVNNAIVVKQLGAFDHQANGIIGTQGPNHSSIHVAIYNKSTHALVAGLDEFISGNADEYTGNYRMKNVTPVTLPQGTYVIVAKGYNANELNGNRNLSGIPSAPPDLNDGNGEISFTGSSYGDDTPIGFSFPMHDYAAINPWIAGTFKFDVPTGSGGINNTVPITITATDSKGNSTSATAIITVEDPLGACIGNPPCANDNTAPVLVSKNVTVHLNAAGQASIEATDVIQSLTDNCDPNPSVQLSRSAFRCADIVATPGVAGNYQAYNVGTSNGNQAYAGELGLEFKVNNAIVVKQLGAFDHQANGIIGTQGPNHSSIHVAIYNKSTHALVAGLDEFISGNADEYTGNYRMKNVTPVTLQAGTYVIVAKGYNVNELNGNRNVAGIPNTPSDLNDGNGAISFTGSSYGDDTPNGFSFPANDYAAINPWIAGTFKFDVPTTGIAITNKVPITVTATDSKGNITSATAIITVEDPLGACIIVHARTSQPVKSIVEKMVLPLGNEMKVYPNPTTGQFTVEVFDEKGSVTIQVIDNGGKMVEQKIVVASSKLASVLQAFDLSGKPNGLYLIRSIGSKETKTARLIKSR
jgi:hypothetical protein